MACSRASWLLTREPVSRPQEPKQRTQPDHGLEYARPLLPAVCTQEPVGPSVPRDAPVSIGAVSADGVVDITILGAGPVGLSAAYYAGHRDASVRIVESLEQLGGQVAAVYPEKHVYDVAGHPKIQGDEARRALCRAGSPVRRRGPAGRGGGADPRARQPGRRGAAGGRHRQGRSVPVAGAHHHRRPRRLRAAQARCGGDRRVGGQGPALLRPREGRLRREDLRDRGRRRLGARLDTRPAGHGQASDRAGSPARCVPGARRRR